MIRLTHLLFWNVGDQTMFFFTVDSKTHLLYIVLLHKPNSRTACFHMFWQPMKDIILRSSHQCHLSDTRMKIQSSFYHLPSSWQTYHWKWRKSFYIYICISVFFFISLGPFVIAKKMKNVITWGSWEVITIPLEVNWGRKEGGGLVFPTFSISYRWSDFGIAVKAEEIAFRI